MEAGSFPGGDSKAGGDPIGDPTQNPAPAMSGEVGGLPFDAGPPGAAESIEETVQPEGPPPDGGATDPSLAQTQQLPGEAVPFSSLSREDQKKALGLDEADYPAFTDEIKDALKGPIDKNHSMTGYVGTRTLRSPDPDGGAKTITERAHLIGIRDKEGNEAVVQMGMVLESLTDKHKEHLKQAGLDPDRFAVDSNSPFHPHYEGFDNGGPEPTPAGKEPDHGDKDGNDDKDNDGGTVDVDLSGTEPPKEVDEANGFIHMSDRAKELKQKAEDDRELEARRTSTEMHELNETAKIAVWGTEGRTRGYVDEKGKPLREPREGRAAEIRRHSGSRGKEESEAYTREIQSLMDEGFELTQAKLIMDLGEERQAAEKQMRKKLLAQTVDSADPEAASASIDERISEKSLRDGISEDFIKKLIVEKQIFSREEYDKIRFRAGQPGRGEKKSFTEYKERAITELKKEGSKDSRQQAVDDYADKLRRRAETKDDSPKEPEPPQPEKGDKPEKAPFEERARAFLERFQNKTYVPDPEEYKEMVMAYWDGGRDELDEDASKAFLAAVNPDDWSLTKHQQKIFYDAYIDNEMNLNLGKDKPGAKNSLLNRELFKDERPDFLSSKKFREEWRAYYGDQGLGPDSDGDEPMGDREYKFWNERYAIYVKERLELAKAITQERESIELTYDPLDQQIEPGATPEAIAKAEEAQLRAKATDRDIEALRGSAVWHRARNDADISIARYHGRQDEVEYFEIERIPGEDLKPVPLNRITFSNERIQQMLDDGINKKIVAYLIHHEAKQRDDDTRIMPPVEPGTGDVQLDALRDFRESQRRAPLRTRSSAFAKRTAKSVRSRFRRGQAGS